MNNPYSVIREFSPCKDCGERRKNCHGVCEKYNNWKKKVEIINEERKKYSKMYQLKVDGCW